MCKIPAQRSKQRYRRDYDQGVAAGCIFGAVVWHRFCNKKEGAARHPRKERSVRFAISVAIPHAPDARRPGIRVCIRRPCIGYIGRAVGDRGVVIRHHDRRKIGRAHV